MSFALALGIAVVLTPLARRTGLAAGIVDRPSDPELAIHKRPVPVLGGMAVIAATLAASATVGDGLPGSVVAATLVALAAGFADDLRKLTPIVRLVLLSLAGIVLAAGGVDLEPLGVLAGAGMVVVALACANATNLLDGQNGLAGGLAAVAAAALGAMAGSGSAARGIGFALAGAIAGFIIWNLPGRIFLGNGGAYALGTLLAALAAAVVAAEGWRGIIASAACLGVFVAEVLATIARRLRSGASVTSGDRLHAYDILAGRLGSRLRSTVSFWAGGAVGAGIGFAVLRLPVAAGAVIVVAQLTAATAWAIRLWAVRLPDSVVGDQ